MGRTGAMRHAAQRAQVISGESGAGKSEAVKVCTPLVCVRMCGRACAECKRSLLGAQSWCRWNRIGTAAGAIARPGGTLYCVRYAAACVTAVLVALRLYSNTSRVDTAAATSRAQMCPSAKPFNPLLLNGICTAP